MFAFVQFKTREKHPWRSVTLSKVAGFSCGEKKGWNQITSTLFSVLIKVPRNTFITIPAGIYMFKLGNGNTRPICEICSKLTLKTLERCHLWSNFFAKIVNG